MSDKKKDEELRKFSTPRWTGGTFSSVPPSWVVRWRRPPIWGGLPKPRRARSGLHQSAYRRRLYPLPAGEPDLLRLPAVQHQLRHQGEDRGRPGGQDRRQPLQSLDHDAADSTIRPPLPTPPSPRAPSAPRGRPASRPSTIPTASSRYSSGPVNGGKTSGKPSPSTRPSRRSSTAATCLAKARWKV